MDFAASTSGFEACLSHLIYLESNAVILYKFWRPQPTLPWLVLQYSISTNTRTMGSLSSMQGSFANSWLRKQTWRNQKEGRVGYLHQKHINKESHWFTSDFRYNHSHPAFLYLTSRVPAPHVLASHTWCPQLPRIASPSPHTSVPKSPSPCRSPSFIHSP